METFELFYYRSSQFDTECKEYLIDLELEISKWELIHKNYEVFSKNYCLNFTLRKQPNSCFFDTKFQTYNTNTTPIYSFLTYHFELHTQYDAKQIEFLKRHKGKLVPIGIKKTSCRG